MKDSIRELVEQWRDELSSIKEQLIERGGMSSSLEYNLLSCEALRLSCCIADLLDLLAMEARANLPTRKEIEG